MLLIVYMAVAELGLRRSVPDEMRKFALPFLDPPQQYHAVRNQPVDYLRNTGHIKRISYPTRNILTANGRSMQNEFRRASPEMSETAQMSVGGIIEVLDLPIIIDDFDNHAQRRVWKKELMIANPQAYELYNRNLLRANNLSRILSNYFPLYDFEGLHDKELKDQHDVLWKILYPVEGINQQSSYDTLSTEEKVEFAEKCCQFGTRLVYSYFLKKPIAVAA